MPDVGVLNLTIQDNATQAATGLEKLASKLRSVKDAAEGYNLSTVQQQITNIVDAVKGSEKTVQSLGTLFNAITNFSKAKITKIDVEPIKKLKSALSGGINIGQAGTQLNKIREALGGEWNTANAKKVASSLKEIAKAAEAFKGTNLGTVAKNIGAVATALGTNAGAETKGQSALGMDGVASATTQAVESVKKNVDVYEDTVKHAKEIAGGTGDLWQTFMRVGAFATSPGKSKVSSQTSINDPLAELIDYLQDARDRFSRAGKYGSNPPEEYRHKYSGILETLSKTGLPWQKDIEAELKAVRTDTITTSHGTGKYGASDTRSWLDEHIAKLRELQDTLGKNSGESPIVQSLQGIVDKCKEATKAADELRDARFKALEEQRAAERQGKTGSSAAVAEAVKTASSTTSETIQETIQTETESQLQKTEGALETIRDVQSDFLVTTEQVTRQTEQTNQSLEEQLRIRKEIMEAENQARLEKNYANYRDLYLSKMDDWEKKVPEMYGFTPTAIEQGETYAEALAITMREVDEYVDRFIESMNTPQGQLLRDSIDQAREAKLAYKDAAESAETLRNAPEIIVGLQEVQSSTQSMSASFSGARTATRVLNDDMQDLDKELKNKKTDMDSVKDSADSISASFSNLIFGANGLKGAFSRMFPTLSSIFSRLKSQIVTRSIRYAIRTITSGVSEGLKNVYNYSKVIGTSFAPSMDSAATAINTMKNSIGAALAPAISALIPYLKTVVNWFITLVNYVNQFFALINGQSTWTKALEVETSAYDDNAKSAKNASDAAKDLLADWDELNVIQSSSSGSGSTKTDTDYASMFTEVSEYNDTIKNIVEGIQEQFGDIWTLAKKIATVIIGWKFSKAFSGLLGTLGSIIAFAGVIDLEFNIVSIFDKSFLNTGEEGWLVADLLTTLLGGTLMDKILKTVLGGSVGHLGIPISLAVSATAGVITLLGDSDTTALSPEALELSALNALEGGAAAGFLTYEAGFTGGLGFGVGAAATLFFMGINIGLKAIADTFEAREFSDKIVTADFISAGLVAAGLALGEAVLGGTVGTIVAASGVGGIVTLGALFAVEALLTLKEKTPVQWGNYDATEAEIVAFVKDEIFSGEPQVKISLANATFEELGEKKKALEESASAVLGTLHAARLGLTEDASTTLQTQVDTLVQDFNSTTTKQQEALQIAFSLVPLKKDNETGTDSKTILKNSQSRFGELNTIMSNLASDLTEQFDIYYNNDLDEVTRKDAEASIQKITKMMTEIADAISTGQAKAKIAHAMNDQIRNLSQDTVDQTIEYYKQQRDELIEQMTKTNEDAAEGLLAQHYAYEKLAEYALRDAGGDITDKTYLHYKEQAEQAMTDYEAMLKDLQKRAEKEADETLGETEGAQKLRKYLLDLIADVKPVDEDEFVNAILGNEPDVFGSLLRGILSGTTKGDAKEELIGALDEYLFDIVGDESFDSYKSALESGLISYSDIFNQDMMDKLADSLGLEGDIRRTWDTLVSELMRTDKTGIEAPAVDDTWFTRSLNTMTENTQIAVDNIKKTIQSLNDFTVTVTVDEIETDTSGGRRGGGGVKEGHLRIEGFRASGGFVKSGDLIMANENGNIEMMGRMGNQPVVANNQQIISGISQGVATANSGVESRLNTIETLLNRILSKEFVATAVPSSGWGAHSAKSKIAYDKVTG